jgi:hypothetical protein
LNGPFLTQCPMRGIWNYKYKTKTSPKPGCYHGAKAQEVPEISKSQKKIRRRSLHRQISFEMSLTKLDKKRVADDHHRKRYGDPEDVP